LLAEPNGLSSRIVHRLLGLRKRGDDVHRLQVQLILLLKRALAKVYDWLDCADEFLPSDLGFVHAGARQRKVVALRLYSQKRIRSVLLSMTPGDVQNVAALPWPVPFQTVRSAIADLRAGQHAFLWLESGKITVDGVRLGRLGTLSEIVQLRQWLCRHGSFSSLVVISTAPHLRRVRMCCRKVLPPSIRVRLFAIPAYGFWDRDKWWAFRRTRIAVLAEHAKLLLYSPLTRFWDWFV
jgi:hypothetical protein